MVYLLHQILTESAALYPDKDALVCQGERMSYAELDLESSRLAQALAGLGVRRGDRVAIYLNRGISSIVAAFGVLKAGGTYVPIDPLCPAGRLGYIMDRCEIRCLLTSRERLALIDQAFPACPRLEMVLVMNGLLPGGATFREAKLLDWKVLRETVPGDAPSLACINSDLAYILFTSGSTGNPKGVMISHLNALTFVDSAHDFFRVQSTDRFSNICPLHFDMSVFDLYVAIKAAATVVIIPESTSAFPGQLAEVIANNKITVWNSVPSALSLLASYKELESHDLSSLRLVFFAGEQFPLKYLRRLQQVLPGARFCNMYGQTEANSSTYYWVEGLAPDDAAPLPIGRALPNFEVFALDQEGNRVTRPGQEGELYVRAASVASGYLGERERTARSFVTNPLRPEQNERVYRTGDLVHLDPEGNYLFLGRKDQMIKSRGYRIEIGEIESVLCSHPEIESAVVIPIPDELIGNRISVLVVPSASASLEMASVVKYCSSRLPKYMVPEVIEFRDFLPTTSSGKIDRLKLINTVF